LTFLSLAIRIPSYWVSLETLVFPALIFFVLPVLLAMLLDFGIFTVGFYLGILFFLTVFSRREEEE
jgi:hypothetical protein